MLIAFQPPASGADDPTLMTDEEKGNFIQHFLDGIPEIRLAARCLVQQLPWIGTDSDTHQDHLQHGSEYVEESQDLDEVIEVFAACLEETAIRLNYTNGDLGTILIQKSENVKIHLRILVGCTSTSQIIENICTWHTIKKLVYLCMYGNARLNVQNCAHIHPVLDEYFQCLQHIYMLVATWLCSPSAWRERR